MPKNHKSRMKIEKTEVKVRREWDINPVTRIKESNKKYDRAKAKRDLKKRIMEDASEI